MVCVAHCKKFIPWIWTRLTDAHVEFAVQFRTQAVVRDPKRSGDFFGVARNFFGGTTGCASFTTETYVLGRNKTNTICIGQIAASLASLSRTVDDYSALSKKELIPAKQEKAFERVKNFREELGDYRQQFDNLRKEREDAVCFYLPMV